MKPTHRTAIAVIAAGLAVFVLNRVDVRTSDVMIRVDGKRIDCTESPHRGSTSCASTFCHKALFETGLVPETHERHADRSSTSGDSSPIVVTGTIQAKGGVTAYQPIAFTCVVSDGVVTEVMLDGKKVIAKR